MDSTKREQRDEDISPEELKRRMLNLQRSPKKRAAWLRYLYSKKKWRVEYLVGFLLATKETVEREIALISQAADIVPTTDDLCDEKKVILSSPMQGTAAIEDGKYLPPPEWFKQAASKFKERVREISRQRKLKEAQKTEENNLQMKQPASPLNQLKNSKSMSAERAALVARIGFEITEEMKKKKHKDIENGSRRTDAHTNHGGNSKRKEKSKKAPTPAVVIVDSDIEEVPDIRLGQTNSMIAATADAKVDTQPFNSSITTVPRKNETKKRVLIDSKDSEMKRVKVAFNVEQEQTIEAANLNRIVINDPDKKDERNDPGPHDLVNFLRNLEHDLSHLATDLDRQGIKTLAHLVAFASWSEEKLHELFQATLPYLTVPQRFILVHGVKGRAV